MTYRLNTLCLNVYFLLLHIIRFKKFKNLKIKLPWRVLYTQYENIFRRELAITNLDWPFTPSNKSSQNFAAFTSSVLNHFGLNLLITRSISFEFNNFDLNVLTTHTNLIKHTKIIKLLTHYTKGTL